MIPAAVGSALSKILWGNDLEATVKEVSLGGWEEVDLLGRGKICGEKK